MLSILSKSYVGLMLYALLRNEVQLYMEELSNSLHLSNDKNKSKKASKSAKNTETWTTSLFNNAIQNQWALSKADKHNLRKYDALEVIQNEFGSKDDDLER